MGKLQKVLIMAGGTGGHVFPGLAVAKLLREQGINVEWLGTEKGLEARIIPAASIPIHYISISGLRGKGLGNKLLAPFRLFFAVIQAAKVIQRFKPDVVIGMGGFASGPGGIASWLLRRPLIIHEQNAKPGLTNKWLARLAVKILEGFPDTFPENDKTITTGNPVRIEIAELKAPDVRWRNDENRKLRLLVLGGSLGAAAINDLVPQALAKLSLQERPEVYHQAGEKHLEQTLKTYEMSEITAKVVPFIADMGEAYAWADVVLCRAGALTVAELCAAGLGSILVPFPQAADDHQTANANYLVKNKAAMLIQQSTLTADGLANILKQLNESPAQRQAMGLAAYQLRKTDATNKVYQICGEICR